MKQYFSNHKKQVSVSVFMVDTALTNFRTLRFLLPPLLKMIFSPLLSPKETPSLPVVYSTPPFSIPPQSLLSFPALLCSVWSVEFQCLLIELALWPLKGTHAFAPQIFPQVTRLWLVFFLNKFRKKSSAFYNSVGSHCVGSP